MVLTTGQWPLCWWRGWVRRWGQVDIVGVDAQRNVLTLEGVDDPGPERSQNLVFLGDSYTGANRVGKGSAVDVVDPVHCGIGHDGFLQGFLGDDILHNTSEQLNHSIGVGAGVDDDAERGDRVVSREIRHRCDLGVGDDVESSVCIAQPGQSERQVLDSSGNGGDFYGLADVVLIFDEDENTVDNVLAEGLRAQTDSHTKDSGRCEQRAVVEVEQRQDLQERQKSEDTVGGSAHDCRHGAELIGAGWRGVAVACDSFHAANEEADDSLQNQQHDKNGGDFGKPIADHNDYVVVPIPLNLAEDGFFDLLNCVGSEV